MGIESATAGDFVLVDLDKGTVDIPYDIPSLPSPCSFHLLKELSAIVEAAKTGSEHGPWTAASLQAIYSVHYFMLEIYLFLEDAAKSEDPVTTFITL